MNILPHFSSNIHHPRLTTIRQWIDSIEIKNSRIAQLICSLIPPTCPFARTIVLQNRTLFTIPPLCHFNPFYKELIALRFRALIFLSEQLPVNIHQ